MRMDYSSNFNVHIILSYVIMCNENIVCGAGMQGFNRLFPGCHLQYAIIVGDKNLHVEYFFQKIAKN